MTWKQKGREAVCFNGDAASTSERRSDHLDDGWASDAQALHGWPLQKYLSTQGSKKDIGQSSKLGSGKACFEPEKWQAAFEESKKRRDTRGSRIMISNSTMETCRRGAYISIDPSDVLEGANVHRGRQCQKVQLNKKRLAAAAHNTCRYESNQEYTTSTWPAVDTYQTSYSAVNQDCIDAAFEHTPPGSVPVNMASARNPGGGYKTGAGAQEENLHRRTNLFMCLEDPDGITRATRTWSYPIPEHGGLYSPDVCVFRSSEDSGYAFLPEPRYMSVVSVAAYSNPDLEKKNGQWKLSGRIVGHTKKKIQAILSICLENGHHDITLSALGCGAYRNPPGHIAELFQEVLRSPAFRGRFRTVIFAILDDHNANKDHNPHGNYTPFANLFNR
eukprot:GFYU01006689.1.p1 GENE.GFYU01006689.1~~GFYU01006689.1.p1  ORF type:complete len:388 (-),score=54.88 GFYU01006689.1:331-1494(-)